jgi:hypothetical protein
MRRVLAVRDLKRYGLRRECRGPTLGIRWQAVDILAVRRSVMPQVVRLVVPLVVGRRQRMQPVLLDIPVAVPRRQRMQPRPERRHAGR